MLIDMKNAVSYFVAVFLTVASSPYVNGAASRLKQWPNLGQEARLFHISREIKAWRFIMIFYRCGWSECPAGYPSSWTICYC